MGEEFLSLVMDAIGKYFPVTQILGTASMLPVLQRLGVDEEPDLCLLLTNPRSHSVSWVLLGPQLSQSRSRALATCDKVN